MRIYRKKMGKDGTLSPTYYVQVIIDGKRIRRSTGQTDESKAKTWARRYVSKLRGQSSAKGLVENFRDLLTGGKPIKLGGAFALYAEKPRKSPMGEKQEKSKEGYWQDFVAFIGEKYPQAKNLAQVTRPMAEAYINQIRTNGRFVREATFKQKFKGKERDVTAKNRSVRLSPRTCNVIQTTLQSVFEALREDAGLLETPFAKIPKQKNDYQSREAFTKKELDLIAKKADTFLYPIFLIGLNTGLREGDICTLKWKEVDFKGNWIRRVMRKTGRKVKIPILPGLRIYLKRLRQERGHGIYALPRQAWMYRGNPDGISYRVKALLDELGIRHTRKVPGRSRLQTTKDVHSLRHTFCYIAAVAGIPLPIVQSIVGHVDPKITELYADHITDRDKEKLLQDLPDYLGLNENPKPEVLDREPEPDGIDEILELLETANVNNWQLVIRDTMDSLRKMKKISQET